MSSETFSGMAATSPLTAPVRTVEVRRAAAGRNSRTVRSALPADHPLTSGVTADSPLLVEYRGGRDAAGNPVRPNRRPVWFMRQAGRSLPEYRTLREGTSMLDACLDPEMAAEITLQPVRRHDVDAAIFFSDIVIPLRLAGIDVEIVPNVGPVLGSPVRTRADVEALPTLDDDAFAPITEAVRRTVAQLGSTPLIGFAGAPFTLAAYMVEGRPSRDHLGPRTMMHADPDTWDALASWAADVSGRFMRAQLMAGASAAQLFDSWAGSLGRDDYAAHVQKHSAAAFSHVAGLGAPLIHFGTGTGEILDLLKEAGADVVGIDYRVNLAEATRRLGAETPLQGNIDPALLTADWDVLETHVREVVAAGSGAAGHVLNLGHGVPPSTDPEVLTRVVSLIHEISPAQP
ncbi:uroporphyrinogen decarboxylase [Nesterenkonia xinjiangensis]|uniref:Uroporphyrinogen decarboxylase n=1 Tax=Nesterenkonia xinjiangensis TaxID=225327 RepID=A0A7Z0KB35_9MICC|nr:uroporphyrinogen decarboxylase [Nesterenkonia xinjiangensis]NYJ78905.1 uroporphyrinogen decarboxylase [Nesterenkonia xinjiangensis]